MQFPESWLRSIINPSLSTHELAHQLTMAGLEVEKVYPVAPEFSHVVVAKIISLVPHPDADRLKICQVDDGSGQLLQIVCGAPNATPGMSVALAKIGAQLPGGLEIREAKVRGINSFGMLCSARELGINHESTGLMHLEATLQLGESIRSALNLDDQLIEIKLTPNRADCLSVFGIAREVAALNDKNLLADSEKQLLFPQGNLTIPVEVSHPDKLAVKILASELCGRFSGRIIKHVNAAASTPEWMKQRLERAGQRSISILVDISNYVMIALGRPSHFFDLEKINGALEVDWANPGENVTLLNGQTITLTQPTGVIKDQNGVKALAGIMGAADCAVSLETTSIYIETAFWWPEAIAGRARALHFSSEASHRFERGVDYLNTVIHLELITALVLLLCGGSAGPVDDQIINLPKRAPINLRPERCARVLGIIIPENKIEQILKSLGFEVAFINGVFEVQPPSYRFDINIEEDLIEEVARVYGFEQISSVSTLATAVFSCPAEAQRDPHRIRQLMAALDYQEVINFSFIDAATEKNLHGNPQALNLLNPIASQYSVLRSSLLGGLINNLSFNLNRRQSRVRLFEIGRIFKRDPTIEDGPLTVQGIDQSQRLAGLAYGLALPEQWGSKTQSVDYFDVRGDLENLMNAYKLDFLSLQEPCHALHPGRSAQISLKGEVIGWLGELHPRWVQFYELPQAPLIFELNLSPLLQLSIPKYQTISAQPLVYRDLALWVSSKIEAQLLLNTILQLKDTHESCSVLQQVALFDYYQPHVSDDNLNSQFKLSSKEKSLAFRLTLQDAKQTLDEAAIESCIQTIVERLEQQFGAHLRSS